MTIISILIFAFFSSSVLQEKEQVKEIRNGQIVYIVATRAIDNKTDLSSEKKVKEEFGKQKTFKVATSAASADFVFLILTEYDTYGGIVGNATPASGSIVGTSQTYLKSAFAVVVPASVWTENKNDLEKIKENSIWQGDAPGGFYGASLPKLVKKFHEQATKKK